jgi:magnesium-transporting ATPase (P-type)
MITGDHPATAMNVASQIGLRAADQCITGPDLACFMHERCRDGLLGTTLRRWW